MAAEWHYGQGEEQHGPVPLEELKQLVASGQVQPTDMVWNADMPDWLPAKDVGELFPKQVSTGEPAAAEASPSVAPVQPSDAGSVLRRRLPSLRAAVIGVAALCVVGLIVAGSIIFFLNRQKPVSPADQAKTEDDAKEQQPEDLPEKVEHAQTTLKTTPADPDANLVVGRYCCFNKGDWEKGLPMLKQGSDAALKQLATTELSKPTAPEDQKKLGDGWWDFAGDHVKLAWKSSQQRAVYWYREALPHLNGSAIVDIAKKLKRLDEQPPAFEVLTRRATALPDESLASAHCTDLTMEVGKKNAGGPGAGHAGLALKGVRFLGVVVNASPNIKWVNKNSFAGFMVDYYAGAGYAKRVALNIGVFDKERVNKAPHWGKNSVPDEYVDLGKHDQYELDLQQWAPPDWDGRVWFGTTLEAAGGNTSITAKLMPLTKLSREAGTPQAKGTAKPTSVPVNPTKDNKG